MATKLRRVTISLPDELDRAMARFSKLSGTPQSRFIVNCLVGNITVINTLSDAIELANNGHAERSQLLLHKTAGMLSSQAGEAISSCFEEKQ